MLFLNECQKNSWSVALQTPPGYLDYTVPQLSPPKVVSNIWKVRNLIGLGFRLKLNLALAEKRSTGAQRNCNSINGESSSLFADARSNESVQENQIFGPDSVNHGFQN